MNEDILSEVLSKEGQEEGKRRGGRGKKEAETKKKDK